MENLAGYDPGIGNPIMRQESQDEQEGSERFGQTSPLWRAARQHLPLVASQIASSFSCVLFKQSNDEERRWFRADGKVEDDTAGDEVGEFYTTPRACMY